MAEDLGLAGAGRRDPLDSGCGASALFSTDGDEWERGATAGRTPGADDPTGDEGLDLEGGVGRGDVKGWIVAPRG